MKSGRETDGVVGGQEALLAEGVKVERAAVVTRLEKMMSHYFFII